jgi:hypothetical protein
MKLYFIFDEHGLQITQHAHKTVGGISVRSVNAFDIHLTKAKKPLLKMLVNAMSEKELFNRHILLAYTLIQILSEFEEEDFKQYVIRLLLVNVRSLSAAVFPPKVQYDFSGCSLPHRNAHYEDVYKEDDTLQMLGLKGVDKEKAKSKLSASEDTPKAETHVKKKKQIKQVKFGKSKKK